MNLTYSLVSAADPSWPAALARLQWKGLPASRAALFPQHFMHATFPRIGGQIVHIWRAQEHIYQGLLFPRRGLTGRHEYTLRLHPVTPHAALTPAELQQVTRDLSMHLHVPVVPYDPLAVQTFQATHSLVGGFDIGQPDAAEAAAVRRLQQVLWQCDEDALYPADLHSLAFRPATSLVARYHGQVVGFLFGFHSLRGTPAAPRLTIESQLLGVLPAFQGRGLAVYLKQRQAYQARQHGIITIHWTADPLQFGNAVLNFARLGAVAFEFYPCYYPFHNVLNQVPASRLGITWQIHARTGSNRAWQTRSMLDDLLVISADTLAPVAAGLRRVVAPTLALEVPSNWTALQQHDLQRADWWRCTTDAFFQRYLGRDADQYTITGVALQNEHGYLVARRSDTLLTLAHV